MQKIIILSICYTLLPACFLFSGSKEQTEIFDAAQPTTPPIVASIPDRMQCVLDKECHSGTCEYLRIFTRKENVPIPKEVKAPAGTQAFFADISDTSTKVCIPKGVSYCSASEHKENMDNDQSKIVPKLEKNQEYLCIVPSQGNRI